MFPTHICNNVYTKVRHRVSMFMFISEMCYVIARGHILFNPKMFQKLFSETQRCLHTIYLFGSQNDTCILQKATTWRQNAIISTIPWLRVRVFFQYAAKGVDIPSFSSSFFAVFFLRVVISFLFSFFDKFY